MSPVLLDFLKPYAAQILGAITTAAVLFVRAWVQKHVAVLATAQAETRSQETPMAGAEKKTAAIAHVCEKLPLGVRPLTKGGMSRLVENAVPAGKAKASSNRPPKV
jgi:hypothetical protein